MLKFLAFVVLALSVSGQVAQADAQIQSRCDQARDPHSFACADETFLGRIFPLFNMNGSGDALVDNWQLLTYADVSGKPGPEFTVLTNPKNPNIPEGIMNTADKSMVGVFDWNPRQLTMASFGSKGHNLVEVPGKTVMLDAQTVETRLARGNETQGLQCRMFLRENNDHLLCRWYTLRANQFVLRGYLGFLRIR